MNIVIFLNCDLLELEIRDSYKETLSWLFLSISYDYVFEYRSSHRNCSLKNDVLKNFGVAFMACMMNVFLNRFFYPIVYTKADAWYFEWQQMATSDNEWKRVVQRMITRAKERQRVAQRVTTSGTASDNDWQRVTTGNKKW